MTSKYLMVPSDSVLEKLIPIAKFWNLKRFLKVA
jgi:hypothetical protein